MADPKAPPKPRPNPIETLLGLFVVASVVGVLIRRFRILLENLQAEAVEATVAVSYFERVILPVLKFLSFGVSVLAVWGIVWSIRSLTKLNTAQNAIFAPKVSSGNVVSEPHKNRRWEKVLEHINSTNSNDWKFAILEADIILDELLDVMGYRGETLSDKLKRVERSDFETLEFAWEAHKVRNAIAHEGANFLITEREARRVVGLYEKVFEEFHYI